MSRARLKQAAFLGACAFVALWAFGRAYSERRARNDAREVLETLGRMQDAHRRLQGVYTEDVSALADMSDDWKGFMESLDALLDLRAGFKMELTARGYRITARARDRKRTVVVYEGGPPAARTGRLTPRDASR